MPTEPDRLTSASTPDADGVEAEHHPWRVLGLFAVLMGLGPISTDLYLPAMPTMARDLGARSGELELTISSYLVGYPADMFRTGS